MHIKSILHNSTAIKPNTQSGIEPRPDVSQVGAMSTAPRRHDYISIIDPKILGMYL
jgi:hypothetical protein